MQRRVLVLFSSTAIAFSLFLVAMGDDETPPGTLAPSAQAAAPDLAASDAASTADEARGRARLLHEAFHATLQFVHDEYYRPDQRLPLPATTLERVFRELATRRKIQLHWLAVNARAMNVDHNPRDEFEKQSVTALTAGKDEFERVENGMYRYAGAITLTSDCLKCHLPNRTSTKDRAAAIVISIPLAQKQESP